MTTMGLLALVATLAVGVVIGLLLRRREGRISTPAKVAELPGPVRDALDDKAAITLVQISTTFCAPCRHARAVLSHLAESEDGIRHVDLDVTERPEVARELGVLRTPTTVAYDGSGRELLRVGGVPRREELLDALRAHIPPTR